MAVEGNTQHGDSQEECNVLALGSLVVVGFQNGPYHDGDEQEDIDYLARIERTAQHIDEEQLKPAAYLHDARHHAIEHGSQDDNRDKQGDERTLQVALGVVDGELAIVVDQHDGRQAQQVQQVDTDG